MLTIYVSDGSKDYTLPATLVISSKYEVLGTPMSYPNPFKPGVDLATIKYTLTLPTNIKLPIYNSAGKLVRTLIFSGGVDEGGLGGPNEVPWDGIDNFGNPVANGPYLYFIISDGKVIGKGEMAAFK